MKKSWYLKTLLIFIIFNGIPLLIAGFVELRFIFPILALLIPTNIFILFYYPLHVLKKLEATAYSLKYLSKFKDFKESKTPLICVNEATEPFALCFGNQKKSYLVFSNRLLEILSTEEIKLIIQYYQKSISQGGVYFFSTLSALTKAVGAFCYFFNFSFLKKKKTQKIPLLFSLFLKTLGFFLKKSYLQLDQWSTNSKEEKDFARLLWKVQSLYHTEPSSLPVFLSLLHFANPLTQEKVECYIPLQPPIKQRVKSLIGTYPP